MGIERNQEEGIEKLDEIETYAENEYEKFSLTLATDPANVTKDDTLKSTWLSEPPMGGLERGEVAELVAFYPRFESLTFQDVDNAGTTPGSVIAETEITRTPTGFSEFRDLQDQAGAVTDDTNWNTNAATAQVGDEFLYFNTLSAQMPFNDTTNGSGGGGHLALDGGPDQIIDYRDMYEHGPLFFWDENEILGTMVLDLFEVANVPVSFEVEYQTVWDIWEVADGPLKLRES